METGEPPVIPLWKSAETCCFLPPIFVGASSSDVPDEVTSMMCKNELDSQEHPHHGLQTAISEIDARVRRCFDAAKDDLWICPEIRMLCARTVDDSSSGELTARSGIGYDGASLHDRVPE